MLPVRGGYTKTARHLAELPGGRRVFVKAAVDELTAGWLRDEYRIYALAPLPFLPDVLGWDDDGERPVLVLEDLSGAHWPPPWRPGDVETVVESLGDVAATAPPPGLPPLETYREELDGWPIVAADPEPFLSLGLCSGEWLEAALPTLREAAASCPFAGDALVHFDLRSDNVCLRDGRALIVDWNWAAVGDPTWDVAAWVASLAAEGGPRPEELLRDGGPYAAVIAGFFAARAGLPPPPTADPRVRDVRLAQLREALPWAARALGLPRP